MTKRQKKERKTLSIPIFLAIYVTVIAVCIALDQITKHFVDIATLKLDVGGYEYREDISIIGNWLVLHWTTNQGATGSLFSNLGWQNWLFFLITLIGLPVFGWLLWRSRKRSAWGQVAFSFIIGGTIGNAIDRIAFAPERKFFGGGVRDFIQVQGFFGIFNIADSFLVVGVILALLAIVFFDPDSLISSFLKERKAKKSGQASEQADENDRTDV